MKSFVLSRIPEIVFGSGLLADLGPKATALGGMNAPILVVADPALKALGITPQALDSLAKAGHAAQVYDGLKGEPKAGDIDTAAGLARDMNARAIVGLGGGSALDTAKLVACCAVTGKGAAAYELCATPLPANRLPIIAIPTTAGTGS